MRTVPAFALLLPAATSAQGHFYRIGNLEIVHRAIMQSEANSDCTCAAVTLINHGAETAYFLGADLAIAGSTKLHPTSRHAGTIDVEIMVGADQH